MGRAKIDEGPPRSAFPAPERPVRTSCRRSSRFGAADAPIWEETRWPEIVRAYDSLLEYRRFSGGAPSIARSPCATVAGPERALATSTPSRATSTAITLFPPPAPSSCASSDAGRRRAADRRALKLTENPAERRRCYKSGCLNHRAAPRAWRELRGRRAEFDWTPHAGGVLEGLVAAPPLTPERLATSMASASAPPRCS